MRVVLKGVVILWLDLGFATAFAPQGCRMSCGAEGREGSSSPGPFSRRMLFGQLLGPAAAALTFAGTSNAVSPASYDEFAQGYDSLDGGAAAQLFGIDDLRRKLVGLASGRVLEVACGTGLQFPLYGMNAEIDSVDAIDLSPGMLREAQVKVNALKGFIPDVSLKVMNAEALEFEDETFDTVLDTFSLCVFENPEKALAEMKRVCRPGGKVLLLENSRSDWAPLGAYQDVTADVLAKFGGKGCKWNQAVDSMARGAGLRVESITRGKGGLFALVECRVTASSLLTATAPGREEETEGRTSL
jgi:methyltransferase OMS1